MQGFSAEEKILSDPTSQWKKQLTRTLVEATQPVVLEMEELIIKMN